MKTIRENQRNQQNEIKVIQFRRRSTTFESTRFSV